MQCFLPALIGGQHNFHHTHSQPFHLLLSSLQSHVFQHLAAAPCPRLWLRVSPHGELVCVSLSP